MANSSVIYLPAYTCGAAVWASGACHNKGHTVDGLKPKKWTLTFWEPEVRHQGVSRAELCRRRQGRSPPASPSAWWLPVFASIFTWSSALFVSPSCVKSLDVTCFWNLVWPNLKVLKRMTFAETPCPDEVTFWSSGGTHTVLGRCCYHSLSASASPFPLSFRVGLSDGSVRFQQAPSTTHSPCKCCGVEMQVEFLRGRSQFPRSPQKLSCCLTVLYAPCSPSS